MKSNPVYVRGFAGILSTANPDNKFWPDIYFEQAVRTTSLQYGKVWSFGESNFSGIEPGGKSHIVGRLFNDNVEAFTDNKVIGRVIESLKNSDGRFSLFLELGDGTVVLSSDWLGLGPLFYTQVESNFYFASALGLLTHLLDSLPPLNNMAVASMLAGSFSLNGDTIHAGIQRLTAGQLVVVHRQHQQISSDVRNYIFL